MGADLHEKYKDRELQAKLNEATSTKILWKPNKMGKVKALCTSDQAVQKAFTPQPEGDNSVGSIAEVATDVQALRLRIQQIEQRERA